MKYINVALAKGRLADSSVRFFEKIGINCAGLHGDTRKLIFTDDASKFRFYLVKPVDVPTYVEYGAADLGIVGKDTLLEEARDLYEVLDLGFAKCRMVLAGPDNLKDNINRMSHKRVATKYPRIAREYFAHKRGETVEIIRLGGSVELAPLVGLSELIVDLVETGNTLKDNGLVVYDTIADLSARLVVNRVSMKMKSEEIGKIIEGFRAILC